MDQAKAQVEQAKAQIAAAEARLEYEKEQLKRLNQTYGAARNAKPAAAAPVVKVIVGTQISGRVAESRVNIGEAVHLWTRTWPGPATHLALQHNPGPEAAGCQPMA